MKLFKSIASKKVSIVIGLLFIQTFIYQNVKSQCENEVSALITNNSECNSYNCDLLCFESATGNDDVSAQMVIETSENGDEITISNYPAHYCQSICQWSLPQIAKKRTPMYRSF